MDEFIGPPLYNYFLKEKPRTTNQQYGYFYKEEQAKKVNVERIEPPDNNAVSSSNSLKTHPRHRLMKLKSPLPKAIKYHTIPSLLKYRKDSEVGGGRKVPDTCLTRVKGIQLWHAHTGSLVHIKP
ncbi:unnamed protein product [Schistosoma turkestanicum]|nr:unnamed protein product [Schistosoma turkestanicum]